MNPLWTARIRTDKPAAEADLIETLRRMIT